LTNEEDLPPITRRYLLCLNVKCYRDADGRHYFDPLWHKDLSGHVYYLKSLTLASPCEPGEPPRDAIAWNPPVPDIQFVDLPATDTNVQALLHLPWTLARLWRAIGRAEIAHFGVAGWPIPYGWLACPMAVLRGTPYLIVVESAPWRVNPGVTATLKSRIRARLSEALSRWCINRARLVILTQEDYRKTLLTRESHAGHIIHASWVDEENIISAGDAAESWQSKSARPLKLLFAGRLMRSKGVL
jgi:glycosyltransferase involved in cell wall biosynthesis